LGRHTKTGSTVPNHQAFEVDRFPTFFDEFRVLVIYLGSEYWEVSTLPMLINRHCVCNDLTYTIRLASHVKWTASILFESIEKLDRVSRLRFAEKGDKSRLTMSIKEATSTAAVLVS
jgi:hypothetical protein